MIEDCYLKGLLLREFLFLLLLLSGKVVLLGWIWILHNLIFYYQMDKSQKIFDYTVFKRLGEGAFGEVLLAEKNGRKVAIKKICKKQIIKVDRC